MEQKSIIAAEGRKPVITGCKRCDDCFHCDFNDCVANGYEITKGYISPETVRSRGLRREAMMRYRAEKNAYVIAAQMNCRYDMIQKWICEDTKTQGGALNAKRIRSEACEEC